MMPIIPRSPLSNDYGYLVYLGDYIPPHNPVMLIEDPVLGGSRASKKKLMIEMMINNKGPMEKTV